MCCCSCFLYYSYMVDGFGIYSLFFFIVILLLMHMRRANKCAKTKCEYAMEENHVYSAKDRENQSSQAYEIFILYIHVQIVAESKVLWLFQFCRKKTTKIVGDFRFETWFTSSYNLDAILMSFHYSMNIFGVMNVFNFGLQVQCHGFQLCFSTHKIS